MRITASERLIEEYMRCVQQRRDLIEDGLQATELACSVEGAAPGRGCGRSPPVDEPAVVVVHPASLHPATRQPAAGSGSERGGDRALTRVDDVAEQRDTRDVHGRTGGARRCRAH